MRIKKSNSLWLPGISQQLLGEENCLKQMKALTINDKL